MNLQLEKIFYCLMNPGHDPGEERFAIFDPAKQFNGNASDKSDRKDIARSLNASFLILLGGKSHPLFEKAVSFLSDFEKSSEWGEVIRFYTDGIEHIRTEIGSVANENPQFANSLDELLNWVRIPGNLKHREETLEKIWALFFPEAVGLRSDWAGEVDRLRKKRTVTISELNPTPITDPAGQIIMTANVLLTIPKSNKAIDESGLDAKTKNQLRLAMNELQSFWFDHPVLLCGDPKQSEVIYGLRGLDKALAVEKSNGSMDSESRMTCLLSVSTTHPGLKPVSGACLKADIDEIGGFSHLDVYAFTETDTQRMIREILAPAAEHFLEIPDARQALAVFGVDGEYGRHYSFLKAGAAFWKVLMEPDARATFKIDLDQVFPQRELIEQTGATALEHFKTDLWGALGIDAFGREIDLGMIAGALVNESDIETSIFTPDVKLPAGPSSPDAYIFYSALPQALSTEAEMMTRYNTDPLDGKTRCIQRIHITGGTNGILIDRLFKYRPFTPSFIGRAEDQAYLLSVLTRPGAQLAYVHKDGLIMRHDKEAFAQEAIKAAGTGNIIGDYLRMLNYSAYARILSDDETEIKNLTDPFTGSFISRIPVTVVYLRFALKAASLFASGNEIAGVELVTSGAKRLSEAMGGREQNREGLRKRYERERAGWNLYYDTLEMIEKALRDGDDFALNLRKKSRKIMQDCALSAISGI